MSATTTVERFDFESTPKEIDFKTSSSSPEIVSVVFDIFPAIDINSEISIIDLFWLAEFEDKLLFKNPNIHLFWLTKTEGKIVYENSSIEIASRCKGIFELTGDELRYCIAAPGQPKPLEFSAPKGSGHTLVTLKRSLTDEEKKLRRLFFINASGNRNEKTP